MGSCGSRSRPPAGRTSRSRAASSAAQSLGHAADGVRFVLIRPGRCRQCRSDGRDQDIRRSNQDHHPHEFLHKREFTPERASATDLSRSVILPGVITGGAASHWQPPRSRSRWRRPPWPSAWPQRRRRPTTTVPGRRGSTVGRGASSRSRRRSRMPPAPYIDSRIVDQLRWITENFEVFVIEGYAGPLPSGEHVGCPDCHVRTSEHKIGLAVDLIPLRYGSDPDYDYDVPCNRSWRDITRLARWAEPSTGRDGSAVSLGRLQRRRLARLRRPPPSLVVARSRVPPLPAVRLGPRLSHTAAAPALPIALDG